MKYLISLAIICFSFQAFSGTKSDKGNKAQTCQIELSGKLGLPTDSASIGDILAEPVISTAGCSGYTITSFQMSASINGKAIHLTSTNNHLTSEMLNAIKQITKATRISIQTVQCTLPNGRKSILPGMNLKVYQKK
jgi:hypothetical protein